MTLLKNLNILCLKQLNSTVGRLKDWASTQVMFVGLYTVLSWFLYHHSSSFSHFSGTTSLYLYIYNLRFVCPETWKSSELINWSRLRIKMASHFCFIIHRLHEIASPDFANFFMLFHFSPSLHPIYPIQIWFSVCGVMCNAIKVFFYNGQRFFSLKFLHMY